MLSIICLLIGTSLDGKTDNQKVYRIVKVIVNKNLSKYKN